MMTELQLICSSAKGKAKKLDSQTYAEYGPKSEKRPYRFNGISHRFRITRTV